MKLVTDLKSVLKPDSSIGERSWIILAALIEERDAWKNQAVIAYDCLDDFRRQREKAQLGVPDDCYKAIVFHRALVGKYK